MLKKCNALRIFVITILIGMVFVVNLGSTFARFAYEKKVAGVAVDNPDETVDKNLNTYLNDVVINNSTTLIPISYNLGKVNREINFDYSFSQNTDIAITYELEYTDSSAVNNVKLDVVNRDKYIWDMPTVNAQMGATLLNSSSSTGTLFYLDYVPAGTGTFKILSGVEFFGANNVVKSYKATTNITINNSVYSALTSYNEMEYAYTQETIARYWKVSGYSD
ncbi:MAG: hypothetical protein IJX26_02065 [Clostridia bacterium]|nr:hypothetical protein [Clostridia bacterium]